jgi:prenyltransferase beta subunit
MIWKKRLKKQWSASSKGPLVFLKGVFMRFTFSALSLLMFTFTSVGQTEKIQKDVDEKQQTIKYLRSLQQPDGGFLSGAQDPKSDTASQSSLRATSSALRALKYFGDDFPDKAKAAAFVKSCFEPKTGTFGDKPGAKGDIALTAVGLMAIVELKMKKEDYADQAILYLTLNAKGFEEIRIAAAGLEAVQEFPKIVKDWIKDVEKTRKPDGSYGEGTGQARATGSAVAMILRVGGTLVDQHRRRAIDILNAGQRADGAYGKENTSTSDLESTYRVLRAYHLLKEKPKDIAKIRAYVAKCRNEDGGYGVEPNKPSSVGSTYYAGVILHWLDEMAK